MNNIRQTQSDDLKIAEIIHSFSVYALGDIRFNIEGKKPKPIAAFILCSCLIDQLAAYAYNHGERDNHKFYKKFISDYLKKYNALQLYKALRCLLVHNYSVSEQLSLSTEQLFPDNGTQTISATHITARGLYNDLKKAFEKFANDLRNNTSARKTLWRDMINILR